MNTKQTVKLNKLIDCHMLSVELDATDLDYYMIFSTNITTGRYHYSITVRTKCNYLIIDFRVRLEKE